MSNPTSTPADTLIPPSNPPGDANANGNNQPPANQPPANQAPANQAPANQPAAGQPNAGAPPPVTYSLALPQDALVDASAIERTTAFAKAAGLSPEAAQKVLEMSNAEAVAFRDAKMAEFQHLSRVEWVKEIETDPELGGKNLNETKIALKVAADRFLTDADRQALNESGFGNHPLLVRMFARIGKAMRDDGYVMGGEGATGRDRSLEGIAARMYPTTK